MIDNILVKIQESAGKKKLLQKQLQTNKEKKSELEKRIQAIELAQSLIQTVAGETQNQLKDQIEDIVNTGLDLLFPETYIFKMDFISARGKTECDIYLQNYDGCRVDPLQDNGGGLADIVSFSLRLACWTISSSDNLIVLDEPFKFLSMDLRPLAGELLQTLSHKLNLQIIMVTHDKEMIDIADNLFEVQKNFKTEKSIVINKKPGV